jgi:DNA-binding response OmpR family regulator
MLYLGMDFITEMWRTSMSPQANILVIEDEPDTLGLLHQILTKAGFNAMLAENAAAGLRAAYQSHPDAIILDIMMPDMDGFTACQRLREMTDVPILFLTGKATDTSDIVKGFSVGADEYMTKPFSVEELLCRLKACLRRQEKQTGPETEYLNPTESVVLDRSRHELVINGNSIYLCPKEFQVMELLIRHAGHVLSQDALLAQVWGTEHVGEPDLVKQYIYRLRKRIRQIPGAPQCIHSVRGSGYYFEADS